MNTESSLVSVLIATYNQRSFVRETLDSVLKQDYERLQIIVCDDGSTDGTQATLEEIAREHPGRIELSLSPRNEGISANVNHGLALARGEYIAWLGGDDLMEPSRISTQVNTMRAHTEAAGCCHDAHVFESETGRTIGLFSEIYNGRRHIRSGDVRLWYDSKYRMLPSTLMTRSSCTPASGFDVRLRHANDWLFFMEVFESGRCVGSQDVLTRYRRHSHNVTSRSDTLSTAVEEGLVALAIADSRYPRLVKYSNRRRRAYFAASALRTFSKGQPAVARQWLKALSASGSPFRAALFLFALALLGGYVSRQISALPQNRTSTFRFMSKIFKTGL